MGFLVPSISSIVSGIEAYYFQAYGPNLNTSPDTPDGQLIYLMAEAIYQQYQIGQQVYSNSKIYEAQGAALEELTALSNVYRVPGYPSICQGVILSGVAATFIPQGSIAQSSTGSKFYSAFDVTLNDVGSGVVDFVSAENGSIVCPQSQLNTLVTKIPGWTGVSNPSAAIKGALDESDSQLRQRFLGLVGQYSMGYVGTIQALVKKIIGVNDCVVYNNPTRALAPAPWLTPPNSVAVLVDYLDQSLESAIAYAIFQTIGPIKTATLNDGTAVNVPVTDAAGTVQNILFYRANKRSVYITINLTQNSQFGEEISLAFNVALSNYVKASAKINQPIYYSKIVAQVATISDMAIVEDFFINVDPNPTTGTSDLYPSYYEIFTLNPADISINVLT